ncbi:CoA transferase [Cupriavidus necator]|uniref:CaiB/BaiF CoA transferase family protein n=1 Tax=Cupriavidus necator TaxID=106590 RepID=UPI003ECF5A85
MNPSTISSIHPMTQENIFSGLKVLDVASFIAGPAAATILSDFGATVVKVEPPTGDPYRDTSSRSPYPASPRNYAWQLTGRNKRSIALNLKDPAAREVMNRLVIWADVLVTNYPPNVRRKLGLDYETLAPLNERLVYADITGYGERGAEADKPGFDITAYWARSGLMHMTHDTSGPPSMSVPGIGDHATASTLYGAIVTGLYQRERTGKGCKVGTSLIAEGAWAAAEMIEAALNDAKFPPQNSRTSPDSPTLNPYRTADGRWLMLAIQSKDFPAFAQVIGQPGLADDPRFVDPPARQRNSVALVAELDAVFAGQPIAHWKQVLDAGRVIFSVVQELSEVAQDPQMHANGIFMPVRDPAVGASFTVSSPQYVAGVQKTEPGRAPRVGEHTREILRDLGFPASDIEQLLAGHTVVDDVTGGTR